MESKIEPTAANLTEREQTALLKLAHNPFCTV